MKKNLPALTLLPRQARLINAAEGFQLEVISGCLWLTRPDDASDHFLVAGMSMRLIQSQILIQSDKMPAGMDRLGAQYRLVPLKRPSARKQGGFSLRLVKWLALRWQGFPISL